MSSSGETQEQSKAAIKKGGWDFFLFYIYYSKNIHVWIRQMLNENVSDHTEEMKSPWDLEHVHIDTKHR